MSILEKFYSDAFQDGFEYAQQRLFNTYDWYTGVADTDHGRALRLMKDKRERLDNYDPLEDHLVGRSAAKYAKKLDREGESDDNIRYKTADREGLKLGGKAALALGIAGAGIGALTGRRGEDILAGGAIGGLTGLAGGSLVGAISGHRTVNDLMDQRDRDIFERRMNRGKDKKDKRK